MKPPESLSATTRVVAGSAIGLLALLLLAAGWTIPFRYESFSILYKFGMEKTYLRVGKMVGITLALLVFFQILLASRFTFFERIFSRKVEFQLHRTNGMAIACLAVLHPVLIKASENFTPYTFTPKYYPEFLGIGLFGLIMLVSGTAFFRAHLKMPYPWWLRLHRLGATLVVATAPAHILWVSDTFEKGVPRTGAVIVFSLAILLAARIWLRRIVSPGQ